MQTTSIKRIVDHLRQIVQDRGHAALSDGQLLDGYLARHEAADFEALIRRHGPMVFGVCKRVLGQHHNAEDAFQATFQVLVCKAASIQPRELVGNWLYGVAYQTARKARASAHKRQLRETPMTPHCEPAAPPPIDSLDDLQPLLDQELSRLRDKYRGPIVLCDLEGKSRKQAAQQLGVPEGTINSRLARGRAILAKRLTRRGVTLSAGALAAALSQQAASAGVPASLIAATVKTGIAGGASAEVAVLAKGVLKGMFAARLMSASAILLALGLFAVGGGLFTYHSAKAEQDRAEKSGAEGQKAVAPKKDADAVKDERAKFMGTWQLVAGEAEGQKYSEREIEKELRAKIQWLANNEGRKLPFVQSRIRFLMTYDAAGNWKQQQVGDATFTFMDCDGTSAIDPVKKPRTIDLTVTRSNNKHAVENELEKIGRVKHGIYEFIDENNYRVAFAAPGKDRPTDFSSKAGSVPKILLMQCVTKAKPAPRDADKQKPKKADQPAALKGAILDDRGEPVNGVRVYIRAAGPRVGAGDMCCYNYPGCGNVVATDVEGRFLLDGLDSTLVFSLLITAKGHVPVLTTVDPREGPVKVALRRHEQDRRPAEQIIRGRVVDDKGKPVANALIDPHGWICVDGSQYGGSPEDAGIDLLAITDEFGEFRIGVAEKIAAVYATVKASHLAPRQASKLLLGAIVNEVKLVAGTTVTGKVVKEGKPLPGVTLCIRQDVVEDLERKRDRGAFMGMTLMIDTDANGNFRFENVPPDEDFVLFGVMNSFRTHGALKNRRIVVKENGTSLDVGTLKVDPGFRLSGRIVYADGKPVPEGKKVFLERREDCSFDVQITTTAADGAL